MIEITSEGPDNLIVAVAHGEVTGEDYEKSFVPAIEKILKIHKKIRLIYQIAADFEGYTTVAMSDDVKLGFGHFTAFDKIAVVADVHWIANAVKVFGFFMPCPVKCFNNAQLTEGKNWVTM